MRIHTFRFVFGTVMFFAILSVDFSWADVIMRENEPMKNARESISSEDERTSSGEAEEKENKENLDKKQEPSNLIDPCKKRPSAPGC